MQTANVRYIVLIGVLLAGAGLFAGLGEPRSNGNPRWPVSDAVYLVEPWTASPLVAEESSNHTYLISRNYRSPAGVTASLFMVANQAPKLYAAGAEVPFLGNGFTVAPAPADIVPLSNDGVGALVAERGTERWVMLYAYGERRGLLGNGPLPWSLAVLDGIVGTPNDYYKMYLTARGDRMDGVAELAHTLFPRIATWYAD
jgi:hypothetical protein